MRYVAIDVETANGQQHSICQIGVVLFEGGIEVASERVFIDPCEEFSDFNVRIHGIRPSDVAGQPRFSERHAWLERWIQHETVVSHSWFDHQALTRACSLHGLALPPCTWMDSCETARAAWPHLPRHRLKDVANALGIQFRHHDALEDARACGLIVHHALIGTQATASGATPQRAYTPYPTAVSRSGDGDGALVGESIVFTGNLTLDRNVAADMAAAAGANVRNSVSGKTTIVVVGDREIQPGWADKSTKQRKAEELISAGGDIMMMGETDFLHLAQFTEGENYRRAGITLGGSPSVAAATPQTKKAANRQRTPKHSSAKRGAAQRQNHPEPPSADYAHGAANSTEKREISPLTWPIIVLLLGSGAILTFWMF